jgi:hypothetical protein
MTNIVCIEIQVWLGKPTKKYTNVSIQGNTATA